MFLHTTTSGRIALIAFAVLIAIVAIAPVSFAQGVTTHVDTPTITVHYTDLNLATPEGSRVLYKRLVTAAEKVCPPVGYVTELRQNRDAQRCIAATVEQAVKQVKSPQFAQVAASEMR
jgi:UrcA family protein